MHKIGMTELLVILAIALVIFGPRALPKLGRSIGKTIGMFKKGIHEDADDEDDIAEGQPAKAAKKDESSGDET